MSVKNEKELEHDKNEQSLDHEEGLVVAKPSRVWILFALGAGAFYGLGNTVYGIHLSQYGLWGTGFVGPIVFILMMGYRIFLACQQKSSNGKFIDYENSNYWRRSSA